MATQDTLSGAAKALSSLGVNQSTIEDLYPRSKLPRKVRAGGITFEDHTPWCVFPNAVFKFPDQPITAEREMQDLLEGKGVEKDDMLPEDDIVTAYYYKHQSEQARIGLDQKMLLHNTRGPETAFAALLPLEKDGNTSGQDYLLYGTDLSVRFFRRLAQVRMARATNDTEAKHALWFAVDYSIWPESTLEVCANSGYQANFNRLELDCITQFQDDMEAYNAWIERTAQARFKHNPNELCMNMKPLKSPGTDTFLPDGLPFSKKESIFLPGEEYGDASVDDPCNAWQKYSWYPLKKQLLPLILPRVRYRLRMILEGKVGDPFAEFDAVNRGCARESVRAFRVNNPDELRHIVSVDKSRPIWDVTMEDVQPGSKLPPVDADEEWQKYQGKPREHTKFVRLASGGMVLKMANVSPYQFCSIMTSKIKEALSSKQLPKFRNLKTGVEKVRRLFSKWGSALRIRGIYPAKWTFNMFDGTVAKLYAIPLEHSKKGFPNLKASSAYLMYHNSELAKPVRGRCAWALDVSHFETFFASNPEFIRMIAGNNPRRQGFFADAACGWIATVIGRRWHGSQTSSGIGFTSHHSLMTGLFLASMDIAYRGDINEVPQVAQSCWRSIIAEGIAYAQKEWGTTEANPFVEYVDVKPTYHIGSHTVEVLNSAGSDDEGGYDQCNTMTDEEVQSHLTNPRVDDWRKRTHMSLEFGGAHFGIFRNRDDIAADPTGASWKLFFIENKALGDLIAMGMAITLQADPELAHDVQQVFDEFGFGSINSYSRAIPNAQAICRAAPEYFNNFISSVWPEESPRGQQMSEILQTSGFEVGTSLKLPVDLTQEMIRTYLDFVETGAVAKDVEPSTIKFAAPEAIAKGEFTVKQNS